MAEERDHRDDAPRDDLGEAAFVALSAELARRLTDALGPWVQRSVLAVAGRDGRPLADAIVAAAAAAAERATAEVGDRIRTELGRDADEQRVNPMALVRTAVPYATAVLAEAGVPPVERDPVDTEAFPDDAYGLVPARFADVDPELHDLGLAWGAARALVHRRRHG